MIEDLFKTQKVFKLVCGAGNEDIKEIEKLVALYSTAGCNIFDLSANLEVVRAAKRGLEFAGIHKNRYLCVSVGIKGDPHVSKAFINSNCIQCGACLDVCAQNAIKNFEIDKTRCIGCSRCVNICTQNAIEKISHTKELKEVLPPIIDEGIDCIELHACGEDDEEVFSKWNEICVLFNGLKSVCIDRSKLSNAEVINRIKSLSTEKIIVQADGYPMSGGHDDYKTTLQAIAMAEIIQNANLPVYLMLSGGTNSKTATLANMC
ncbi:4Fe-4S binding protein, partial [bacterium]|nr:4Fe-4S binding protein [bacterium]